MKEIETKECYHSPNSSRPKPRQPCYNTVCLPLSFTLNYWQNGHSKNRKILVDFATALFSNQAQSFLSSKNVPVKLEISGFHRPSRFPLRYSAETPFRDVSL